MISPTDIVGSIPVFRFMPFQVRRRSIKVASDDFDHPGFRAARICVQRDVTIWSEGSRLAADIFAPDDLRGDRRYPALQGAEVRASEVAEIAVQAILDGRFWIFTHQRDLPLHLERVQAMVSGANPPKIMPEDIWTT